MMPSQQGRGSSSTRISFLSMVRPQAGLEVDLDGLTCALQGELLDMYAGTFHSMPPLSNTSMHTALPALSRQLRFLMAQLRIVLGTQN
jgi:hypothetical protein